MTHKIFPGRKSRKIKYSIAFKMTATYSLLFGLILILFAAGITYFFTMHEVRSQNLERLAGFVTERLQRPDSESFDLESFALANDIYIEVRDENVRSFPSRGAEAPGSSRSEMAGNESAKAPDSESDGTAEGKVTAYGQKPADASHALQTGRRLNLPMRRVMLRVMETDGFDISPLMIGLYAGILVLLTIATVLLGARRTRQMLTPVALMTQTARSISASDLSTRIAAVTSHDELRELADTFNEMLGRIQESYEKQNRFVSDASHELRTPLSVISGYANLLRRWGTGDREVLEESVEKIIEETDNMQQLVDRLLFLARADQKTQHVRLENFDLSALMREVADETRMIDSGHTVSDEIEAGVFLTADEALVKQAVRAIVENSIKYTPEGGEITLFCRDAGVSAEFGVRDNGIGISEKDLPHIFDRFYKADAARTRAKGSSGLGLSIVKWIVDRHGGQIRVESETDRGAAFTISLPKQQA
jgi:two-component system, OmpR family, sensor histidine kinase ArlS